MSARGVVAEVIREWAGGDDVLVAVWVAY